jgi:hypothetical protein
MRLWNRERHQQNRKKIMLLTTPRAQVNLADDEVVRLHDAVDSRLEVTSGFVWVTIEGESNDVVLGVGQFYVVDSTAAITLSALRGPATVKVKANVGATRGRVHAARLASLSDRVHLALTRFSLSSVAVA